MDIRDYEPKLLWKHFDEVRKIPRCSKHEEGIREYVTNFAIERNLDYTVDDIGNVVIRKPATPGMEKSPTVVLQGHLDMVCEKNSDKDFDFSKDAIELKVEDGWLTADGTTLGADNGIGICTSLAILDSEDVKHGPIEALFTVDEETGLTGAFAMAGDLLKGRIMLNLDSEDLHVITVGCAGGGDSIITLPVEKEAAGGKAVRIMVKGLRGGHSGVDIHEQRGNAIKVLARLLWHAASTHDFSVADIRGGNLRNAIPREAEVVLIAADPAPIINDIQSEAAAILSEIKAIDKDLRVDTAEIPEGEAPKEALSPRSALKVIGLLNGLPHGVQGMSFDIPELVETSCNLAVVTVADDILRVQMSSRSSIGTRLRSMRDSIRSIATLSGATVEEPDAYPGWRPDMGSSVLAQTKKVMTDVLGKEPAVKAIHAGLECGVIGEKLPGIDMVSIGPDIRYPHSPEEKVSLRAVESFYDIVLRLLERVA